MKYFKKSQDLFLLITKFVYFHLTTYAFFVRLIFGESVVYRYVINRFFFMGWIICLSLKVYKKYKKVRTKVQDSKN